MRHTVVCEMLRSSESYRVDFVGSFHSIDNGFFLFIPWSRGGSPTTRTIMRLGSCFKQFLFPICDGTIWRSFFAVLPSEQSSTFFNNFKGFSPRCRHHFLLICVLHRYLAHKIASIEKSNSDFHCYILWKSHLKFLSAFIELNSYSIRSCVRAFVSIHTL